MKNIKAATKFLLFFLIAYLFMLMPKAGIQVKYADFFCWAGNDLFHEFGDSGIAMLKTRNGKDNILLLISKTSNIKHGETTWQAYYKSSNLIGFFHSAFLLSLIIATPISWKRKAVALIMGFFLITCIVMLKLFIMILYYYSISTSPGPGNEIDTDHPIAFWYLNFSMPFARGYTIVVFLWLLLCIGKREWLKLNGMSVENMINLGQFNKSQISKRNRKNKTK